MTAFYQLLNRTTTHGTVVATYKPTIHAQGAWNVHEQHMAPATGILTKELEAFNPRPDMRIGRISLDIFGMISLDEFTIETHTIRPGKTIELLEATMRSQGKTCIVARAWRMIISDSTAVAGLEDATLPNPDTLTPWEGLSRWPGGYIQSLTVRVAPGRRPGKGMVWLNTDTAMVDGEPTSDLVHLMGLVDTANGTVCRQPNKFSWAFPNLDLQIHLYRLPSGPWLGLETVQQYGSDGIGLTSTVLHDIHGPFGRSEQILTLRRLENPF